MILPEYCIQGLTQAKRKILGDLTKRMCFLYEYACFRLLSEVALEANETILTANYSLLYVMTTGNILMQAMYILRVRQI